MSSTWTFGKSAAALRAPVTGTPFYLLAESTCESNVYPRRPSWSNVFFGTLADAMRHAVRTSCSAESGCLKAGNGRSTTPEKQIGTWREALKTPVPLLSREVELPFGDGIYKIPSKLRDEALQILLPLGASELNGHIAVTLDAPMVCEALAGLIGRHWRNGFSTWRVFPYHHHRQDLAATDFAHAPRKTRSTSPLGVTLFRGSFPGAFGDRFVFMIEEDGTACLSHDWRLVQTYCATHAAELEVREPGTAESRISEFRDALSHATGIPPALEVRISVRDTEQGWLHEHFDRLCKEASATPVDREILLTGAQLETTNTLYLLQSFERHQIRVSNLPPATPTTLRETASLF